MLRTWMRGSLRTAGSFCAVALACATAVGGILQTRDGRTIEGDISERGDQVVVVHNGITFTIDRADVVSMNQSGTIADEYRRRHEKLGAQDLRGRLDLAQWLISKKQYDMAHQVLDEAHAISPRSMDLAMMERNLDLQQEIEITQARKKGPVEFAAAGPTPIPPTTKPASRPAGNLGPNRPLTADEINLVRQNELNDTGTARFVLKNDVQRTYVAMSKQKPADFNAMPVSDRAMEILKNGTPDMKANVIVANDPLALAQYKQLQRSIVAGCARCHTYGKSASQFSLRWPAGSDGDTYANFMILDKYSSRIGERSYQMIDRGQPADSLLLLYSLPPKAAANNAPAHPGLNGKYMGVVRGTNDPSYQHLEEWLTRTLNPVSPDYSTIDVGGAVAPPAPPKK